MNPCPVCGESPCSFQVTPVVHPGKLYSCRRCGQFILGGIFVDGLPASIVTSHRRAALSHRLRAMQRNDGGFVLLNEDNLSTFHPDDPLPFPAEQADRMIMWIGNHQPSAAESAAVSVAAMEAWIGATIIPNSPGAGFGWLMSQDKMKALVEQRGDQNGLVGLRLKMAGWERYEAIKRATIESRTAFMAMKFGDQELNRFVEDYLKPAVDRAGFELRLLSDKQPAGLIDDQMRVALRTSRFVIADLTHENKGAYWEAGFAEGLGRPVIYTCRKQEWETAKVHFDTNHLVTIVWDSADPDDAARRLTATIRATLPAEAKMTD